jgi:hypothetical protein
MSYISVPTSREKLEDVYQRATVESQSFLTIPQPLWSLVLELCTMATYQADEVQMFSMTLEEV